MIKDAMKLRRELVACVSVLASWWRKRPVLASNPQKPNLQAELATATDSRGSKPRL